MNMAVRATKIAAWHEKLLRRLNRLGRFGAISFGQLISRPAMT